MMRVFLLVILFVSSGFWKGTPVYDGLVGTRGRIAASLDSNNQAMSRSASIARTTISRIGVVIPNVYVDNDTATYQELGSGSTATVTASIEYPLGTCTQLKFSGASSGSILSGSVLASDEVTLAIPTGEMFWVRIFWVGASGVPITLSQRDGNDAVNLAASGLSDQTVNCDTVTHNGGGNQFFPLAITGPTTQPSVCFVGDSIDYGYSDVSAIDMGFLARSIGPGFGYASLAAPGDEARRFVANHAQRDKILAHCSHLIVGYGHNDLSRGQTLAQLETNLTAIYGLSSLLNGPAVVFQRTLLPSPSSTDACTTLGGQTVPGWESDRVTFNTALRAASFGPAGGQFDTASVLETSSNSGFWITSPRYSADCVHPSNPGYVHVTDSGVIDLARIHRP